MNGQSRDTGNIGYTRHRKIKRQRKPKWQSRMNNPEKLATLVNKTLDEDKQNKNRKLKR